MKTESLRAFYELSQTLNYRKTADKLYISQSALTRQIASLEKEIGFSLFVRTTRSVKLTRRGQALLKDVEDYLNSADRLNEHIRMLSSDSPITLAYFGPPNLPFVSTIFNEWIRKYPDLRFDIITDSLDRMIKMLQSGEIDALITLNPSVAGLDGIGTKRLERINPAVILPRDHVLSKNKFISVEELRSCGPVLLPKGPNRFADKVLADQCRKWSIDANTEIESEALAYHVSCREGLGLKPVFFRNDNQNLFDTVQIPLDDGTGLFNRVFAYSYENENPMFKKCLEVVDSCISGRLFD